MARLGAVLESDKIRGPEGILKAGGRGRNASRLHALPALTPHGGRTIENRANRAQGREFAGSAACEASPRRDHTEDTSSTTGARRRGPPSANGTWGTRRRTWVPALKQPRR